MILSLNMEEIPRAWTLTKIDLIIDMEISMRISFGINL